MLIDVQFSANSKIFKHSISTILMLEINNCISLIRNTNKNIFNIQCEHSLNYIIFDPKIEIIGLVNINALAVITYQIKLPTIYLKIEYSFTKFHVFCKFLKNGQVQRFGKCPLNP